MAAAVRTEATERFWHAFQSATGTPGPYDVVSFGEDPDTATRLAELVVAGRKRATAGLLRQFVDGGETLPIIGGHVVLVDGDGHPRAVWRTTELRLGPLSSVEASFAQDEGEGDRTRASWLDAHHTFFGRIAEQAGFELRDDIETVFERFRVVWPPDLADAAPAFASDVGRVP